jgi:hypothetical protein
LQSFSDYCGTGNDNGSGGGNYDMNDNSNPDYNMNANPGSDSGDSASNYSLNGSVAAPPPNAPSADSQPSDFSGDPNPVTGNVAESTPTVLLYAKDGTTYAANDYWMANNQIHYRVKYGGEGAIDINDFDMQRTVDENARRGVRFSLKPSPDADPAAAPAAPQTSAPAPLPDQGQSST